MSLVCLLSALHAMRTSLIAPDVIRHGEDITVELPYDAGNRFEQFVMLNATPMMKSCMSELFKDDGHKRSFTIEGVKFTWPVWRYPV